MYPDDEKLVAQTLSGDRDAFGVLVHKYQEMVYTYVFQKVRNEADAQDVTQEVFLRAYRNLYQLRHPHQFRSWLYTIMSNECNRWLVRVTKTRQRETGLEDATEEAVRIDPKYTTPTEEWRVDLEQAIAGLPDDNRVAVSMFYMSNCSLKEISEFLGVSVNTVKGKLHRARQQLGSALSDRYGKFLKDRKLKGGFLMQVMKQINHIPAPTMTFTWSSSVVAKIVFSLITAFCILIGSIAVQYNSLTEVSMNRIKVGGTAIDRSTPLEVALLPSIPSAIGASPPVIPVQTTEGRLRAVPAGVSSQPGQLLADRGGADANAQLPAAAAEAEDENIKLSVRVVNQKGLPMSILPEIKLFARRTTNKGGGLVTNTEVVLSMSSRITESVSHTGGVAQIALSIELPRSEIKRSEQMIAVATHPEYGFGWRKFSLADTTDVEIQLAMPGVISGKIMNEAGEPIQNAEARVQYLFSGHPTSGISEGDLGMDAIPIAPAKTNANGAFILHRLPEGAKVNLAIQGPGYAKQTRFTIPVGTDGLEFWLKREGRIEGNLSYAETGVLVANAMVAIQGIGSTHGWGRANTDANGNYLLKNLAPGTYNLYLYEGPEGWTAVAKELIEIVEGQTVSNINLTLVRGGFITGRVTDKETGEPIANHHIGCSDAALPNSQAAGHAIKTDKNGAYRFYAAPGRASVETGPPQGYMDVGPMTKGVDVVEAETVVVDFQFLKGMELVGWVLTDAGEPVAGAQITNADIHQRFREYGKSSEKGEFTVSGLRPGQKLALKAEHSKLQLRGRVEIEVQQGALLEIHTQRYERVNVYGRVVNGKGEPIPSATISRMRWHPHLHMGTSTAVTVTDGDGRYRELALIVGDKYVISASAKGYQGAETARFTVTAEMSKIADLVLLPIIDQFFIEGRITDTAGEAVPRARVIVTISQRSDNFWETLTNDNGDYRLENLPMPVINDQEDSVRLLPIVLELNIDHSEYAWHIFERLKPNQRHDLVLIKADGYLIGKVVDADGKPIEGAIVGVDIEEDQPSGYVYAGVRTNVLGEFELKHIKDKVVPLYVSDERDYKVFKDISVNQRDMVLTFTPAKPKPKD